MRDWATFEWTQSTGCRRTATAGRLSCPASARRGDAGNDQRLYCCPRSLPQMEAWSEGVKEQDWGLAQERMPCWMRR